MLAVQEVSLRQLVSRLCGRRVCSDQRQGWNFLSSQSADAVSTPGGRPALLAGPDPGPSPRSTLCLPPTHFPPRGGAGYALPTNGTPPRLLPSHPHPRRAVSLSVPLTVRLPWCVCVCVRAQHAHVHTCTSQHTHPHMHTHTHPIHVYTYPHIHTHTYTHVHKHPHIYTLYTHTHTPYTDTGMHIYTHLHTYPHTNAHTHTAPYMYTQTYTCRSTATHIPTHMYTYMHTRKAVPGGSRALAKRQSLLPWRAKGPGGVHGSRCVLSEAGLLLPCHCSRPPSRLSPASASFQVHRGQHSTPPGALQVPRAGTGEAAGSLPVWPVPPTVPIPTVPEDWGRAAGVHSLFWLVTSFLKFCLLESAPSSRLVPGSRALGLTDLQPLASQAGGSSWVKTE